MKITGAPSSLSSHLHNNSHTSACKCFSQLGKLLGFRATSTNDMTEQSSGFSYSTARLIDCLGGSENHSFYSDKPLLIHCSHNRILNHSVSTPVIRLHSPSEASTSCSSPTSEDVTSSPWQTHSLPTILNENIPVIESKPNSRRRWRWNLPRRDKSAGSSPHTSAAPEKLIRPASPLKATFVPTPALSTIFPVDTQDLQPLPTDSRGSDMTDDMDFLPNPTLARRKSMNKLARTLGVTLSDFDPRNSTSLLGPSRPDIATSRRMSLPINTAFTAVPQIQRLSSHSQIKSGSGTSTSNTDDLYRFDLPDDLFDNSGEILSRSSASIYSSYSPISPLIFNPPTPIIPQPPRLSPSTENMKPEAPTSSLYSHLNPTLHRSRSMTLAPLRSKFGRLVTNTHTSDTRPDTRSDFSGNLPLPVKANWLESTPGEVSRNFIVAHPEYMDEYETWSGQWNQDSVRIMKMLRTLK